MLLWRKESPIFQNFQSVHNFFKIAFRKLFFVDNHVSFMYIFAL